MNLILSDVEETIMIVEQPDSAPEGQSTVNVGGSFCNRHVSPDTSTPAGSQTEDGHVVCARRRCHSGAVARVPSCCMFADNDTERFLRRRGHEIPFKPIYFSATAIVTRNPVVLHITTVMNFWCPCLGIMKCVLCMSFKVCHGNETLDHMWRRSG